MMMPGLKTTLAQVSGTAGDHVTAALNASLTNTDIPVASGGPTPLTGSWKARDAACPAN